ncbi:protein artemis-like [Watersipora subatra]|uniref:protein artemis-like n=1 Tax=Watersipora subatra TaxID=2589382 RepID=UPI00355C8212
MVGLSSSKFSERLKTNRKIKLYCTEVTRKLLSCMKDYTHLTDYTCALPIDEPTLIGIPILDGGGDGTIPQAKQVTLTAIPAGHCPGSAMLLIEGEEGNILYTGDFRFEIGTARLLSSLHDTYGNPKNLLSIHCDTTFFTPKAHHLASRSECEEAIVKEVKEHISQGPQHHVLLRVKAKLGYENVYRVIYDHLGVKTHIQKKDGHLYSQLPDILETITTDPSSQVHACCQYITTENDASASSHSVSKCETLQSPGVQTKVIHLSTIWFVESETVQTTFRVDANTVRCCYSFHSSYTEIADFIQYLRPKRVYPNVIPIQQSKEKAKAMLQALLTEEVQGSFSSDEEQVESWKPINGMEMWWKKKRKASSDDEEATSVKVSRPAADNISITSTTTRASTPEMDLWSDEEG